MTTAGNAELVRRAAELRAIADGRLMLNVRNGVTVSRSMLAAVADEIDANDAERAETWQKYVDANEARLEALRLMRLAHAVMRECGWQLAIACEPAGDGVLEAACSEMEADFAEFLKDHDYG